MFTNMAMCDGAIDYIYISIINEIQQFGHNN